MSESLLKSAGPGYFALPAMRASAKQAAAEALTRYVDRIGTMRDTHGETWQVYNPRLGPIWWVGLDRPGNQGQDAITVAALIDTGASHTFLSPSLVDRIGAVRTAHTASAMGLDVTKPAPIYRVDLAVPMTTPDAAFVQRDCLVTSLSIPFSDRRRHYECIIGNNILSRLLFVLDGRRLRFRLQSGVCA